FYAVLLPGLALTGLLVTGDARPPDAAANPPKMTASAAARQARDPGPTRNHSTSADVSGEWKLTGTKREDPDPHELTLVLKQQGDAFSGTLETNRGRFEVKDGKVKGTQIAFSIFMPEPSTTAACSGSVEGDALKATCKMPNSTIDLVGSRHK